MGVYIDHPALKEMLSQCLLFHEAEDASLDLIAKSLVEIKFKKGDPIILEGQLSDHVYFIGTGSVEIVKYRPEIQMVNRITVLKAGNYFSEFSVLNRVNKTASAFAIEDSLIYRMDGAAFLKIVQQTPVIAHRLVMTLAELNASANSGASLEYFDPTAIEHSNEIAKMMPSNIWKKFGILPLSYHSGILLIAAKDPHRTDFFQFCKTTWPAAQINLVLIGQTDFEQSFVKLSKLYSNPVRMAKPPTGIPVVQDALTCLKNSRYFENAGDEGLQQIVGLFEAIDFEQNAGIYKPGDAADYFYLVQSGQVELNHPTHDHTAWTRLKTRNVGAGFGEIALLLGHPHSHLARATMHTRILRMKKANFAQFLNSSDFCLNLAKVLAQRLQNITETPAHKFFDESKPVNIKDLATLIPKQTMLNLQIIPLRIIEKDVTLGIMNPGNEAIYSIVHRYLRGFRIDTELLTQEKFNFFLSQVDSTLIKTLKEEAKPAAIESSVMELNRLLVDGFEARASDLHLEPTGSGYSVRYRIDGVLTEVANQIPMAMGETLVNRIKVLGHMDISNHFTPQDGQLKIHEDKQDYLARVATTPTKQGEGAVLRLIRNRSSAIPLTMLTPNPRTIKMLRAISRLKQGLFLVTGPTGSGKTTTLYSLIAELNRVDVKIISIEDPVELEIAGVTQIEINEKSGLTFDRALRSTLRQDPDVMMLGEIRDADSARAVFEAALQGHLVISTLHTNNSFAVKGRLKELGVPMTTISAGLVGSMAQRLVRSLCKKCRTQRPITESERETVSARLHLEKIPEQVWAAKGCMLCNQSGYQGRLPIIEIWHKTPGMEELLAKEATVEELLEEAKKDGFSSLFDSGLVMALNGLTTIEEIERCMFGGL
ncbi:MAG: ATPase, T2SS/T4P/T4SS family [Bdellovibrionales bacterium]